VSHRTTIGLRWDHHQPMISNLPPVTNTLVQIQKPAPQFSGTAVVNGQFKSISLKDYKGKYVILLFYPLDFTFVCPTELVAFNDVLDKFHQLNCEVIAISVDSHYTHLAFCNAHRNQGGLGPNMRLTMLSDLKKDISRDYGILLENTGFALRGLFIIDGKGILRQSTINDLPVGRSAKETLRLIQAFQFTDQHGEVCPAEWEPGKKTIIPNIEKSRDYFSGIISSSQS
jgi:alkyl hydroperoxide reductase subunit AhpC